MAWKDSRFSPLLEAVEAYINRIPWTQMGKWHVYCALYIRHVSVSVSRPCASSADLNSVQVHSWCW
jgi:hypothetical protein